MLTKKSGFTPRENVKIILLNLKKQNVTSPYFEEVIGDATDLREYPDAYFDIVFSNSVIEHLFTLENQKKWLTKLEELGKVIAYKHQINGFYRTSLVISIFSVL